MVTELLNSTDWISLLRLSKFDSKAEAVNRIVEKFYDRMYWIISFCVPEHIVYNSLGPPWNSKRLLYIKNKKNKYYKKFKISGSLLDYTNYSIFRAEYNKLNQECYKRYISKIKYNFKKDPKSFYNFVNLKKKSTSFPPSMKMDEHEAVDDAEISNLFADFFSSTYTNDQVLPGNSSLFSDSVNSSISIPLLDESSVLTCLKKLKFSYNGGPDNIPSCILINCADALVFPLTLLFNISIKFGIFPEIWKDSFIIPLFKSGSKADIRNYRGIAKLSIIPKLFEKLITDHLCHHVSSLLSPCQHGFRKGCSTVTNLLHFTSLVNRAFLDKKQTDVIYTDFSKAFDKVNHELLLKKLHYMGFTQNCLNWIKSYLSNRKQKVLFKNITSKNISVTSGVPQGSHLGPLLFSLFINDLPHVIKNSFILMYADDVKIFFSFKDFNDHKYLQDDLDSFYSWCDQNLMQLNLKKCKYMCFFRRSRLNVKYFLNNFELDIVSTFSDLGILFDPKLNFIQHITLIVSKARCMLGFIKRWAKEFDDPYITKQLFTSLVRPILEYGSILWDPTYKIHINAIESVQKQFLLFCLRRFRWNRLPSYKSRLSLIKLPSLISRRKMLNVMLVLNIINGNICSDFLIGNICFCIPQRPTRNYIPLSIKAFKTNFANSDPFIQCCRDFNKLFLYIDYSLNCNIIKSKIISALNN